MGETRTERTDTAITAKEDNRQQATSLVEVAGVARALAARYERRLDALLEHRDPVGRREPPVALDVVHARLQVAVALGQIDLQQVAQQVLQLRAEVRREAHLAADDLLVDLDRLVGEERRVAGRHLVHEHTERPPVDRLVVALAQDDLRREILGRAAQRPGSALDALREPKVRHLQVALRVDQQILRLQIAVDQIEIVQVLEREHDLGGVEARVRLGEPADLAQVREHLAARHVLQHHVQVRVVLEVELETDQERERDRLKDALLVQRVLDLLQLHHLLFVQDLHRVSLVDLCCTIMTRPNDPVPSVLIRSKSSSAAVFVGLRFHFSSKSSFAWSRNSRTLSAASTFLFADVALLPMVAPVSLLSLTSSPNTLVLVLDEEAGAVADPEGGANDEAPAPAPDAPESLVGDGGDEAVDSGPGCAVPAADDA
uniref:Uncharacterized protein n=1 Tax=Anopheles farauti TaxID=69004 RepID=A0A182Q467_9DIPT